MSETPAPPDGELNIEQCRAAIDEIDDALLGLILKRAEFGGRLSSVKALEPHETPLRPAREVALLRRLLAKAAPEDAEMVIDVWRTLIGGSVKRQRPLELFLAASAEPWRQFDATRRHFGHACKITRVEDVRTALGRTLDTPGSAAVTPFPGASGLGLWWPVLSESRFHGLSVIGVLPLTAGGEDPEAAVLAVRPRIEPAGGDVTLALAFDPHHRLARALNEAGLSGRELARARTLVLVGLDDFVAADDVRLAVLARAGLDGVRVIGSYARI